MKDWHRIATALDLGLTEEEVTRAATVLQQLDASFTPLRHVVPVDLEPATKFFVRPAAAGASEEKA
jgi:hypothetical protein